MLEARGDQPFSMVKVKGHATASDLRQGLVEEVDLKGNMAADALAVLGACCELGPEEAGQEARVRAAVAIDIQRMMVEILCCRGKTGHGIIRDSGSIDCEGAFQSESHWTLLALERKRQQPLQQPLLQEAAEASEQFQVGCSKCRGDGGGCARCDAAKAEAHWTRIAEEDRCLDPIRQRSRIDQPQPWAAVRYYDTLATPSLDNARLAVAILDALQTVGMVHHLRPDLLVKERYNSRLQKGQTCGWWVLHYIEEELRRFRGEGRWSFYPNLKARLKLLNEFTAKLRQ